MFSATGLSDSVFSSLAVILLPNQLGGSWSGTSLSWAGLLDLAKQMLIGGNTLLANSKMCAHLIALHQPADEEVQKRKEQNHGCDGGVAQCKCHYEQVVGDVCVIFECSRLPSIEEFPLSLDEEFSLHVEDDKCDESRQF
jgi:hypothetical protein